MKKNIKRSVFSLVLCAMLVFCVGFYSSVEPTTAWFSDTGSQSGSFNMDEIDITFTGEGIVDSQTSDETMIELDFKAATKAEDEENNGEPDPMFEHAAEFYTFTAKNNSTAIAQMRINVTTGSETDIGVRYCVYELDTSTPIPAESVTLLVDGQNDSTALDDVYVDENGERVLKIGESYYDARLKENLNNSEALLLEAGGEKDYCIGIWVEYDNFLENAVSANGVRTLECNATVNISATQIMPESENG